MIVHDLDGKEILTAATAVACIAGTMEVIVGSRLVATSVVDSAEVELTATSAEEADTKTAPDNGTDVFAKAADVTVETLLEVTAATPVTIAVLGKLVTVVNTVVEVVLVLVVVIESMLAATAFVLTAADSP